MVILRQTMAELFDSLPTGPVIRIFMQYSTTSSSQPEALNDVIIGIFVSRIVSDIDFKFRDPGLNRYRQICLKVVGHGIFTASLR